MSGPFHRHKLSLISTRKSNYIHHKMWDEITYPFPNFNSEAVEVWEWISNFTPPFTWCMITYSCWDWSYSMLLNGHQYYLLPKLIKIMLKKEAWLFIGFDSPHNKHKNTCCHMIEWLLGKTWCGAALVLCDLNVNGLCENDFRCLQDVMDVCNMFNIVDKPTCFKSKNNSLLDVILTSKRKRIVRTLNINTGISDFHNLIAFSSKLHVPKTANRNIPYHRIYKHFDDGVLNGILPRHPIMSVIYSISQEICTRFCCALLCCGYAITHNEFTWSIYPYSSGLLCWHWGNR